MLPTKFRLIWISSFRRDDFFKEIHQSETRIAYAATMFVNGAKTGDYQFYIEKSVSSSPILSKMTLILKITLLLLLLLLAHLVEGPSELLPSLDVRCSSSVIFSHLNLLL
jgi:hypothetical protein